MAISCSDAERRQSVVGGQWAGVSRRGQWLHFGFEICDLRFLISDLGRTFVAIPISNLKSQISNQNAKSKKPKLKIKP
jgi:hypothetical protein